MARRTYPYYILIGIALLLLFLVSCGSDSGRSTGGEGGGSGYRAVMAGGLVSNAVQITTADNDQSQSVSSFNTDSDLYFVVWSDARNMATTGLDIYGAFVNGTTGAVTGELSIATTSGNQIQPSVAFDTANKRFLVTYTNSVDSHIYGRFVNGLTHDLSGMGNNFVISMYNTTVTKYIPYDDGYENHPAYPSSVVNTVGTGDGFTSIFSTTLTLPTAAPAIINIPGSFYYNRTAILPNTLVINETSVSGNKSVGNDNPLVCDAYGRCVIQGSRSALIAAVEQIGVGTGAQYSFTGQLANSPIDWSASSLQIYYGPTSLGNMVGRGTGSSVIDKVTSGAASTLPKIDNTTSTITNSNGSYNINFLQTTTGFPVGTGDGTTTQFNATLTNTPITPGSLKILVGGAQVGTDTSITSAYGSITGGTISSGFGNSLVFYQSGGIANLTFTSAIANTVAITANHTTDAPSPGAVIYARYNTIALDNIFDPASYIDYDSGSLYLKYVSTAVPGSGAAISAKYRIVQNSEGSLSRSYQHLAQESPHVVYNDVRDVFHVVWLDTSDKPRSGFYAIPGTSVCTNNFADASTVSDTSGEAQGIFTLDYTDHVSIDTKMVRYRDVSFADYLNGDGIDASGGSSDDYVGDMAYSYDNNHDGTVDDINPDGIADRDLSPLDSEVVDASMPVATSNLNVTCDATAESYQIVIDVEDSSGESSPAIIFNPVTGNPVVLWASSERSLQTTREWSRSVDGGLWTGWSISTTTDASQSATQAKQKIHTTRREFNTRYDSTYTASASTEDSSPSAATDIYKNRMLVAWESQGSTGKDIYGQLIDLQNFRAYGSTIGISTDQYDQSAPKVSFDSVNQRYMIVWEDARNTAVNLSNMDIFGQFVDPQGQLSGGNFPVTVNTSNQISPSVVFGDFQQRKFLVTWKDGRVPGNAEIFGQFWEFSQAPQLQITDSNGTPLYDQTLQYGGVNVLTSTTKSFRIVNNGNAPLIINSFTPGSDVFVGTNYDKPFNITSSLPTSSESINPGGSMDVSIRFRPAVANTYSGASSSLSIASNGGSTVVYFSGYGMGEDPYIVTSALPDGATGQAYTTTLEAAGGIAPYSWYVSSGSLPSGLTLTATSGVLAGTPTGAGTYSFNLAVKDSAGKHSASKSYTVNISAIAITTASLNSGSVGTPYASPISVVGGTPNYTWSIINGTFPSGLTNIPSTTATGTVTIGGTPAVAGNYTFEVLVVDSAANFDSKQYTLSIINTLTIGTAVVSDGAVGTLYSQTLQAGGGEKPYTWSIVAGALPPGVTLDANSGMLYGSPTTLGQYTFRVKVTDYTGLTAEKVYTVNIANLQIVNVSTLPTATIANTYSVTLSATGGTSPYTWALASGSLPTGVALNTSTGVINGTPSSTGQSSFAISVTDALSITVTKSFTLDVTSLSITTSSLSDGAMGVSYSQALAASGGTQPYTWSLKSGSLPDGLSLNIRTGYLTGTPTALGTYFFWIEVTDEGGYTSSKLFSIKISNLAITTTSPLPTASQSVAYSYQLSASGGSSPYSWAVSSGSLPAGLTLSNTTSGIISGTPTTIGGYSFTMQVFDSTALSVSKDFTMDVTNLTIATSSLSAGAITVPYSQLLTASGGSGIYSWAVIAGYLPAGLTLDANSGYISGTPTAQGTVNFIIELTDSAGKSVTKMFSITISNLNITTSSLPSGAVGQAYSTTIIGTGGTAPYTWGIVSGALPAGLSLGSSTGIINGTPTALGSYPFTVYLKDTAGIQVNKSFSIGISDLAITATTVKDGELNKEYTYELGVTGGTAPYNWTIIAGSLPWGLGIDSATGRISGTPYIVGTYDFIVQVSDQAGQSYSRTYRCNVSDFSILTAALANATAGLYYETYVVATGGVAPISWYQSGLPTGLVINQASGMINGTTSFKGNHSVTIIANSASGVKLSRIFNLTVSSLYINTTSPLTAAEVNKPYTAKLSSTGGTSPYRWAITSGALPNFLTFDTTSGYITGNPEQVGDFTFTAQVTDVYGNTATKTFDLSVASGLKITTSALPDGIIGDKYREALSATGALGDETWAVITNSLPPGLSLKKVWDSTTYDYTAIDGTPTTPGSYTFEVQVDDGVGVDTQWLTLTITTEPVTTGFRIITEDADVPDGNVSDYYTTKLLADYGITPYTWSVSLGTLPQGLSLNASTGVINGIPTVVNTSSFKVTAVDLEGSSSTKLFAISITDLKITTTELPGGAYNEPYSQTLAASNGTKPYKWSILAGPTPDYLGLSLDQYSGVLSGTPSKKGTYTFVVQVQDLLGYTSTRTFTMTIGDLAISTVSLPGGSQGVAYSTTLSATGGVAPYTWTVESGSLPAGLSLNASSGVVSGTPTLPSESQTFIISVKDSTAAKVYKTYTVNISDLTILTTSISNGATGVAYSYTLKGAGGSAPYSWILAAGNLPSGLALGGLSGQISGTPAGSGTYSFTIKLQDYAGNSIAKDFSITISDVTITTASLPDAAESVSYSTSLAASGGTTPYKWYINPASLPSGLSLNNSTGVINGTPAAATTGLYSFTTRVIDYRGSYIDKTLSILVNTVSITTIPTLPDGTLGVAYSTTLLAAGATPTGWAVINGALPTGLSLASPSGTISGTPTVAGTFDFQVKLVTASKTVTKWFALTITQDVIITSDATLPYAKVGTAYLFVLKGAGGSKPYVWNIVSGNLPNGIEVSKDADEVWRTGTISGTPTTVGTFTFEAMVTDNNGATDTKLFTIDCSNMQISTTSLLDGAQGVAYTQTLDVSGGTQPYSWAITAGNLPTGLTLEPDTGVISGTPTVLGSATFTVGVTDASGQTATRQFTIKIANMVISTASLPDGSTSAFYNTALSVAGGTGPYTWSISEGSLPSGLLLDSSTGTIYNTPATSSSSFFTVTVMDSLSNVATKKLSIAISRNLVIETTRVTDAAKGIHYDQQLTVTGGTPPYVWSIIAGGIPAGPISDPFYLDAYSGMITGTPLTTGKYTFRVEVRDYNDVTAEKTFELNVADFVITTTNLPDGTVGVVYNAPISTSGGTTPFVWYYTSDTGLPPGISFINSSSPAVLYGTPTAPMETSVKVFVRDAMGLNIYNTMSLRITNLILNAPDALPAGAVNQPYLYNLEAVGGTPPYEWSIIAGGLPPGGYDENNNLVPMTLDGVAGRISGIPGSKGTYYFVVELKDRKPITVTKTIKLVIDDLNIATSTLADGTLGSFYNATLLAEGGYRPYSWYIKDATTLPTGMAFTNTALGTGVIYGTPTVTGTFSVDIAVVDANGLTVFKQFDFDVNDLNISTASTLPGGSISIPYSQKIQATGGTLPYTWALKAGALPDGLALAPNTGYITGTPTTEGEFSFVLELSAGSAESPTKVTKTFTITISNLKITTEPPLTPATNGQYYNYALSVSGGISPYTWSVAWGSLPVGLTLSNTTTGIINGTPTVNVTATFIMNVSDSTGLAVSKTLSLTVTDLQIMTTSISDGATGISYSQPLRATGGTGIYTWSILAGALPDGLTLNTNTGYITGSPTSIGTNTFIVLVTDSNGLSVTRTLTIRVSNLNITSSSVFPPGTSGIYYLNKLQVTGGTAPYTWAIDSGSLPTGLSLYDISNGIVNGTPNAVGSYAFTMSVTDSTNLKVSKDFTITISDLQITTTELSDGAVGVGYSQRLLATGGTTIYTWSIIAGTLPAGLVLDSASGYVTGNPSAISDNTFIIQVEDSAGATATKTFSITISNLNITTSSTLPPGTTGVTYAQSFKSAGGTAPYTWAVEGGTMPPGISLTNTSAGIINGTPSAVGDYSFTVSVQDSTGLKVSKDFSVSISDLNITTTSLSDGAAGVTYSQLMVGAGGTSIYTWKVIAGVLPVGLALNENTGYISGTPTSVGKSTFIVELRDSDGNTATKTFSITISNLNIVTSATLPPGSTGAAYDESLLVTGGSAPYSWWLSAGGLPTGLLSNSAGLINGTPSTTGSYAFTMTVQDNSGLKVSKEFSITVSDLNINTGSLGDGAINVVYSELLAGTGGSNIYTWSILAGVLPTGLVLDPATGYISGTPTSKGTTTFIVQLEDTNHSIATKPFTIKISDLNITTTSPLPPASTGKLYTLTLQVKGGSTPYTWAVDSGSLPVGLMLNDTTNGIINGIPSAIGDSSFTISVKDSTGITVKKDFAISVSNLNITTTSLGDGAINVAYSELLAGTGGEGIYTWSIIAGQLPAGLALDPATGYISGTPSSKGSSTFIVELKDHSGAVATDIFTIKISDLNITTTSPLPPASTNVPYTQTLQVRGGSSPYTWALDSGAMPVGISLNSTSAGLINGTPTAEGNSSFTISVKDSTGITVKKDFTIAVSNLNITTTSLSDGAINVAYSQLLVGSGGTNIYTWSVLAGVLPTGLVLDPATGYISGTPSSKGTTTFIVRLEDTNQAVATSPFTITISDLNITTSSPLPPASLGKLYTLTMQVKGGSAPYTWAIDGGTLPVGMMLNDTTNGIINGIPSAIGDSSFTISVTDSFGVSVKKDFTIAVSNLNITTPSLSDGAINVAYSELLAGTGGEGIYTWSIIAGQLPAGLAIDPATGYISGTPSSKGSSTFIVELKDHSGAVATDIFTIKISDLNITTTSPLPPASTNVPYTQTLQVRGGSSPYTWALDSGAMPVGISLNSTSAGLINGTPTAEGNSSFTISVKDSTGITVKKDFTIAVSNLNITTTSLSDGAINVAYSQLLVGSGGTNIYTWSVLAGVLPTGLVLDPATGYISGTPTSKGTTTFIVRLEDTNQAVATSPFTITISDLNITTSSPLPPASTGLLYTEALQVKGGTGPYTWSYTGTLPTGMSLSNTSAGIINGVPTAVGDASFTMLVKDSVGVEVSKNFTISVSDLNISNPSLSDGAINVAYSELLAGSGGTKIYTWKILAGDLPTGLTLDTKSGYISGTPTAKGTTTFTVELSDSAGKTANKTYSITISDLNITTTSPLSPPATIGIMYSSKIEVVGGSVPYTWTMTGGSLPAGLVFNGWINTAAVINGLSTDTAGQYKFTVMVEDAATVKVSKEFALVLTDLNIVTASLPTASKDQDYSQELVAAGGSGVYKWSILAGVLPAGLTLDVNSGSITGKPSVLGTNYFVVQLEDTLGAKTTKVMSIKVTAMVIITESKDIPMAAIGESYLTPIYVSGGTGPYSWWIEGGILPSGMSLVNTASAAYLYGASVSDFVGVYGFNLGVQDNSGTRVFKNLEVKVTDLAILNNQQLPGVSPGASYTTWLYGTGGTGAYAWKIIGGGLPTGLSLDPTSGIISGTVTGNVGLYSFEVELRDTADNAVTKTFYMVCDSFYIVTDMDLPLVVAGQPYATTLKLFGGQAPYTWWMSGTLPTGLSFNNGTMFDATITGTSAGPLGYHKFTVYAEDANGNYTSKIFRLPVSDLNITTTFLPDGTSGLQYIQPVDVTGGTGIYNWYVVAGSLPLGLDLDGATGYITGTPLANGTRDFVIEVADSTGLKTQRQFSITVTDLTIATPSPLSPAAVLGQPYNMLFTVDGGYAPYTWSFDSPMTTLTNLGLVYNTSGGVYGTPTTSGSTRFTVTVQDSVGAQISKEFTLRVNDLIINTTAPLPMASANKPYSVQITATGGSGIYSSWKTDPATPLPVGLTLDSLTGYISGTPTSKGTVSFIVYVTDHVGVTASKLFTITVSDLIITSTTLPGTSLGSSYSATLQASGGSGVYTWSEKIARLGAFGLTLSASGDITSASVTASGSVTFTAVVTDGTSTMEKDFQINIARMSINSSLGTSVMAAATATVAYSDALVPINGTPPYKWEVLSTVGALPDGLALNVNTGRVSGTPAETSVGTNYFIIKLTDSTNAVTQRTFSITVAAAPPSSSTGGTGGGTGTGTGEEEQQAKAACYIATAAYGSYLDPHVDALRAFRDRHLMTNAMGRKFVEFYYRTSPPVAEYIAERPVLKAAVRTALTPVVYGVEYPLFGFAMIALSGAAAGYGIRRRLRRRA